MDRAVCDLYEEQIAERFHVASVALAQERNVAEWGFVWRKILAFLGATRTYRSLADIEVEELSASTFRLGLLWRSWRLAHGQHVP